jgi:hypothetical protein
MSDGSEGGVSAACGTNSASFAPSTAAELLLILSLCSSVPTEEDAFAPGALEERLSEETGSMLDAEARACAESTSDCAHTISVGAAAGSSRQI